MRPGPSLRGMLARDEGSATALSLCLMVACLGLAALAIDLKRVQSLDIQLQNVADASAHAALIARTTRNEAAAKSAAVAIAQRNLPAAAAGAVIRPEWVEFGTWNSATRSFTPATGETGAVRVTLRRTAANGNPVTLLMLQIVGLRDMNLTRSAVMLGYEPDCLREGFVAEGMVDIQSNNTFASGFCIHSNLVVKVSSGNRFLEGTKVSMPDKSMVQMPNSGLGANLGLEQALSSNRYDIRILPRIQTVIDGLRTGNPQFLPAYITNTTVQTVAPSAVRKNAFQQGRIHSVTCSGNQRMTIGNDVAVTRTVILTNCPVSFSNGAVIEDAVIATTNTDVKSVDGPNGIVLGRNDGCGTGGGTQILSLGGMSFASGLQVFGAQLIAAKDISFSASSFGVQGAAFVAGGTISGTSGMTMEFCGGAGMEQNFRMTSARLVM